MRQDSIKPEKPKANDTIQEIKSLVVVIFIALAIRIFLVEPFFVPTGSMKLTILEGDYVFSSKYSYGYSKHSFPFSPDIFEGRFFSSLPQRGDIVIFRPPHKMDIRYIKRLIGLPGDKIQLINDVIYINDKPIKREYIGKEIDEKGKIYKKYRETLPNNVSYYSYDLDINTDLLLSKYSNTEVFYVPEGKYFFMGDNRRESNDSRVDLGYVPFENFIAKAQFILLSTKELLWLDDATIIQQLAQVWHWLASIRFSRFGHNVYNVD